MLLILGSKFLNKLIRSLQEKKTLQGFETQITKTVEGTDLNLSVLRAELSWLVIWVWFGGEGLRVVDEAAEFLIPHILSQSPLEMQSLICQIYFEKDFGGRIQRFILYHSEMIFSENHTEHTQEIV